MAPATGQFERVSEITVFRDARHFGVRNLNRVECGFEPSLEMRVNSFMSRARMPAVFCAIIFVFCEAISRPFAEMGVCDDWSFVRTAQLLAQTGHIRYNGWAACMVGWQLYPAAVFLKLFGFSFTAARMSTFLVAVLTTFLIQRTFVRSGIHEQNATIGTLAIAANTSLHGTFCHFHDRCARLVCRGDLPLWLLTCPTSEQFRKGSVVDLFCGAGQCRLRLLPPDCMVRGLGDGALHSLAFASQPPDSDGR